MTGTPDQGTAFLLATTPLIRSALEAFWTDAGLAVVGLEGARSELAAMHGAGTPVAFVEAASPRALQAWRKLDTSLRRRGVHVPLVVVGVPDSRARATRPPLARLSLPLRMGELLDLYDRLVLSRSARCAA